MMENLTRKIQWHRFVSFQWGRAVLRLLVSVKNLGQYKNLPSDKFEKKIIFVILMMNWVGDSDMKKKFFFVRYHLYCFFLKKNSCGWLKTCSYTCREYYREKDNRPPHQRAFLLQASPRKAFKRLLQNIQLTLDLLYHKSNLLIMTAVDVSILKKILRLQA